MTNLLSITVSCLPFLFTPYQDLQKVEEGVRTQHDEQQEATQIYEMKKQISVFPGQVRKSFLFPPFTLILVGLICSSALTQLLLTRTNFSFFYLIIFLLLLLDRFFFIVFPFSSSSLFFIFFILHLLYIHHWIIPTSTRPSLDLRSPSAVHDRSNNMQIVQPNAKK